MITQASLVHLTPSDLDCSLSVEGELFSLPSSFEPVSLSLQSLDLPIQVLLRSGESVMASTSVILQTLFQESTRPLRTFTFSAMSLNDRPVQVQIAFKLIESSENSDPEEYEEREEDEEIFKLRQLLRESQEARQELQELVKESADQASDKIKTLIGTIELQSKAKESLQKEAMNSDKEISSLKIELENTKNNLVSLEKENEILRQYREDNQEFGKMPEFKENKNFNELLRGLANNQAKYSDALNHLQKEKQEMATEIIAVKEKLAKTHLEKSKASKETLQCQNLLLEAKETNISQHTQIQTLVAENTHLNAEVQALKEQLDSFSALFAEFKTKFKENSQYLALLEDQKSDLESKLLATEHEYTKSMDKIDCLTKDIADLNTEKEKQAAELNMKSQRLEKDLSDCKQYFEAYLSKLKEDQKTADSLAESMKNSFQEQKQSFKDTIEDLQNSMSSLRLRLDEKTIECDSLYSEKEEALVEINRIEQYLCANEDMNQLLANVTSQKDLAEESNHKLREELDQMFEMSSIQAQRNKVAQAKIQELNDLVTYQELQILELQKIKNRVFYLPVKDDPVDKALAEYINKRGKPLEIPFVREDPGIYSYGSKRVFVKLEQGTISIRVGGGYMQFEEFVQLHTPAELEKIEIKMRQSFDSNKGNVINRYVESLTPEALHSANKIMKDHLSQGKFTTMYGIHRRPNSPQKMGSPLRRTQTLRRFSDSN